MGKQEEGGAGLWGRLRSSLWGMVSFGGLLDMDGEISSRQLGMWV